LEYFRLIETFFARAFARTPLFSLVDDVCFFFRAAIIMPNSADEMIVASQNLILSDRFVDLAHN